MKALLLLLLLSGCATRYFTEEEDSKAREVCEATGCVIVPVPVMRELLKRRGIGI